MYVYCRASKTNKTNTNCYFFHQVKEYPNGNFVGPTVISNMTTDMDAYKQEIFGPVLCVINVDTLDEAIELINRQGISQ